MSRLRRIADRDRIFFITTNLAARVTELAPEERDVVLRQLIRQHEKHDFLLFGYVVMPNHLHLLLTPAQRGVVATMHELKRITTEHFVRSRGRPGPVWQARYFDFILRRVHDFWDKLDYIHANPVEAKLAARPEDWRWSSAGHYAANAAPPVVAVDAVDFPACGNAYLWPAPWR